ncbi:hypothetical protein TNCV_2492001 [Trichonephila clavipes]|nr:hypothetical protein TNCV_2492001 [Trichonephila clavipes]
MKNIPSPIYFLKNKEQKKEEYGEKQEKIGFRNEIIGEKNRRFTFKILHASMVRRYMTVQERDNPIPTRRASFEDRDGKKGDLNLPARRCLNDSTVG